MTLNYFWDFRLEEIRIALQYLWSPGIENMCAQKFIKFNLKKFITVHDTGIDMLMIS